MKKITLLLVVPIILLFIGASCADQFIAQSRATVSNNAQLRTTEKEGDNNAFLITNINEALWPEGRSIIMRNDIPRRYSLIYGTVKIDFTTPETWTVSSRFNDVTVNQEGLATIDFERIDHVSGKVFQGDGVLLQSNAATVYLTLLNDVNPDNALQYRYADDNAHSDVYIPHGTDGQTSAVQYPIVYKKMSVDGKNAVWAEYTDPSQKDAMYIDLLIDVGNKTYLTVQLHFGNGTDTGKIHDEMNQFVSAVKIQTS